MRPDVLSTSIDRLIGARMYPVYWCQLCNDVHVDGLDHLFEGHKPHLTMKHLPLDEYSSTAVADYRQDRHQRGTET